jgi:DNA-directed RNA polymerase specialized sigma24 family protein
VSQRDLAALAPDDLVAVAAGRGPHAEHAWRLLVERNVHLDHLPEQAADDPPPGERLQRDEQRTAVRQAFAGLPPACQDLLRLLTTDPPVPYAEIETLLDMAHGSIGPTRRRCLEKLRSTPPMVALLVDR